MAVCGLASLSQAQQKIPDPVPILKQISKQNDDGSYSFGYEAGDGSFKIETKYPDGSVQGKYGYVDDSGKLREVEYGASSKRGFEPQGGSIESAFYSGNGIKCFRAIVCYAELGTGSLKSYAVHNIYIPFDYVSVHYINRF